MISALAAVLLASSASARPMYARQLLNSTSTSGSACPRTYTVVDGDICDGISAANNASTYQLAVSNWDSIDPYCYNLEIGQVLCLGNTGQDCQDTYVVQDGDYCDTVSQQFGINNTLLMANNPQIDEDCYNLYSGEVVCVADTLMMTPPPAGWTLPGGGSPSSGGGGGGDNSTSTTTALPTSVTSVCSATITASANFTATIPVGNFTTANYTYPYTSAVVTGNVSFTLPTPVLTTDAITATSYITGGGGLISSTTTPLVTPDITGGYSYPIPTPTTTSAFIAVLPTGIMEDDAVGSDGFPDSTSTSIYDIANSTATTDTGALTYPTTPPIATATSTGDLGTITAPANATSAFVTGTPTITTAPVTTPGGDGCGGAFGDL